MSESIILTKFSIQDWNIFPRAIGQEYVLWAKGGDNVDGYVFELGLDWGQTDLRGWLLPTAIQRSNILHPHHVYADVPSTYKADWNTVRQWLSHCTLEHKDTCGLAKPIAFPGFVVIDCITRRIISAPEDCEYAALSYVWGPDAVPDVRQGLVPTPAPPLIEDAMVCTRVLGLKHLWIDRYCIEGGRYKGTTDTQHGPYILWSNSDNHQCLRRRFKAAAYPE